MARGWGGKAAEGSPSFAQSCPCLCPCPWPPWHPPPCLPVPSTMPTCILHHAWPLRLRSYAIGWGAWPAGWGPHGAAWYRGRAAGVHETGAWYRRQGLQGYRRQGLQGYRKLGLHGYRRRAWYRRQGLQGYLRRGTSEVWPPLFPWRLEAGGWRDPSGE